MGLGEATQNAKLLEKAAEELAAITGQKAADPQGAQVDRELQAAPGPGDRRHGDAARRPHVGVPRPAGERRAAARARLPGVSPKAFDGRGNYTLGIREQIIFPEIDYDKVEKITGMNVTVVHDGRRRTPRRKALLAHLGMPFRQ